MKRILTMLASLLIVATCMITHADAMELEVRPGDGYMSLYDRYETMLPEGWTWTDLRAANGGKILFPGTLTININEGECGSDTTATSKLVRMVVKPGEGYMALCRRYKDVLPEGWTWTDLRAANGGKILFPGTLTININEGESGRDTTATPKLVKMEVKPGDGYMALFRRYKDVLPEGWTWKNLYTANSGRVLSPGTLTIDCSNGGLVASGTVLGQVTLYNYKASKESWTNIRVSAEKLNGQIIRSGETFDWLYKNVGRCTASAGYVDAPVLPKGTTGIGGGVCFTSTTLYQAAVLNGPMLEIERHDHSDEVAYAEAGTECAISYPYKNQRWKNTTPYDVKIITSISGKSLTIKIIVA